MKSSAASTRETHDEGERESRLCEELAKNDFNAVRAEAHPVEGARAAYSLREHVQTERLGLRA
eukprot:6181496-Pleurochrysis_carterae.AAC.3